MKSKPFIVILIIGAFLLNSCSSSGSSNSAIVGKWFYDKEGLFVDGVETTENFSGNDPGCDIDYIEFNDDGRYVVHDHYKLYNPDQCLLLVFGGTWEKSGYSLHLRGDGSSEGEDYSIFSLTSTSMKLSYDGQRTLTFIK